MHRANGFFIVKEGWEYNLILAVAAVAIAGTGAGRFSVDYVLFGNSGVYGFLSGWWGALIAVALGLAAVSANLSSSSGRRSRPDGFARRRNTSSTGETFLDQMNQSTDPITRDGVYSP
jgi:hypothetical protein